MPCSSSSAAATRLASSSRRSISSASASAAASRFQLTVQGVEGWRGVVEQGMSAQGGRHGPFQMTHRGSPQSRSFTDAYKALRKRGEGVLAMTVLPKTTRTENKLNHDGERLVPPLRLKNGGRKGIKKRGMASIVTVQCNERKGGRDMLNEWVVRAGPAI